MTLQYITKDNKLRQEHCSTSKKHSSLVFLIIEPERGWKA